MHGLGIPAASKNKEAAWAFIQWALSKQNTRRALVEENLASPTRRSDFESPEFKTSSTINGYDLAGIVRESIDISAKGGYMKYRTVPVYPQVDQQLNKAIANIASGQLSARQAMEQAQAGSIAERSGPGSRSDAGARSPGRPARRRAYLTGLVPALAVLAVITVVPTLFLAGASLTPLSLVDPASLFDFSNPLRNYAELLHDPRFLGSLVMQLQLSALTVTLQLAVGLGLALL